MQAAVVVVAADAAAVALATQLAELLFQVDSVAVSVAVLPVLVLVQLVAADLLTKLFSVKFTFLTVLKFRFLTRLLLTVRFLSSTLTT